ncbi:MAG: hypothetical protein JWN86_211 [Planctomycetota bacterium]|nr:hypothetical protein [Planctomycetota bacterium]
MKRIQFRLGWCLWLVSLVAAFLAGVRYGERREAARAAAQNGSFNMLGD